MSQQGRSREGAWIEIAARLARLPEMRVAPARERGLKSPEVDGSESTAARSRKGAWIEIKKPA